MTTSSYLVAFDEAHKPRAKISGNYSELKEHLESMGFVCQTFMEFPITRQNLSAFDLLVIPCPDFAKFSTNEIDAIAQWVKEDGGGLLCLSHAGGDKGRRSNLSELVEKFGFSYENDQVLDYTKNFGLENLPEITNFTPPHPITEGITSLCFRAGCSLSTLGLNVVPVAISNEESEPFSTPLVVTAEVQEGRVVGIGSYEMFRNEIPGGFQHAGHKEFCTNIFNWLKTDYREKIKTGEIEPKINIQEISHNIGDISSSPLSPSGIPQSKLNLSSRIIISDKSDLAALFYGLLEEITVLKDQVQNIINTILSSEEQILETQKKIDEPIPFEPSPLPELELKLEPEPNLLTEMPERPKSMTKPKKKPTSKPSKKEEPDDEQLPLTKEEIAAELETLKNKLNSIENLRDLVDSKYKNGSYTKEQYNKQTERLNNDLNRTLSRIKELEMTYKKKE
ncbi:MAG: hypothetical protein JW776_01725 [Candidatus Lokiarchaeota archaeon]|nr:hypothetical protein [Candidatus Lokiarchaeota archaeon]